MTEHAMLDDNGDKEGTQAPSATDKDGKVAAVLSLGSIDAGRLPTIRRLRRCTPNAARWSGGSRTCGC